jgi:Carboxypeptidase regulatory-like domain
MSRALLFGLVLLAALILALLSLNREESAVPGPGQGAPAPGADPAAVEPAKLERAPETEPAPTRREAPAPASTEPQLAPDPDRPQRLEAGTRFLEVMVRHMDGTPARRVDFLVSQDPIDPREISAGYLSLASDDGVYRLEGLSTGFWHVFAHLPPQNLFGDSEQSRIPYPVPHPGPRPELVLYPAGGLRGTVVDEEGAPAEAKVSVIAVDGRVMKGARANEDTGEFSFDVLPPGPAQLVATAKTGASSPMEVDVPPGGVLENIRLELPPGGWILVTVHDRDGQPVLQASVALLTGQDIVAGKQVDGSGLASFGPLAPGTWSVIAILDGEWGPNLLTAKVEVLSGERTQVLLRPPDGGVRVSGTVTRGGEAVGGLQLLFFREDVPLIEGVVMTETDPEGRYEILIPAPGPARVMFSNNGQFPVGWVVIPEAETFTYDLQLPAGRISGRVRSDLDRAWRVALEREDGLLDTPFPDVTPGSETSSGRFEFKNLRPGRYRLRLLPDEALHPSMAASIELPGSPHGFYAPPLTGLELERDQQLEHLELVVRAGGGLRVRVPAPDATGTSILVRGLDGQPLRGLPRQLDGNALTFTGLPPGPVLVSAQSGDLVAVTRAQVSLEQVTEVVLKPQPGARLEATCLRGRQPIAASIRLFGPGGDEVSRLLPLGEYRMEFTSVLSSSTRAFGPLPPGNYELRATAQNGSRVTRTVSLSPGDTRTETLKL